MVSQHKKRSPDGTNSDPDRQDSRKLLIVDPDRLTRWSVETYLGETFEVLSAPSVAEALEVLDRQSVEAIVVSDDLPDGGADKVEEQARSRNSAVMAVRTISHPVRQEVGAGFAVRLEKPFKLSALAELLGLPGR